MRNRIGLAVMTLMALAVLMVVPGSLAGASSFPEVIDLPNGFRPEGLTMGTGTTIYSGSLADGSIYEADVRTGEGRLLAQGPGTSAAGLAFDPRTGLLFVAGGAAGNALVYDTKTGTLLAQIQLNVAPTFINAVVITKDAAYFTDSSRPLLYRLPLSPGGVLPDSPTVEELTLGGEWEQVPGFNANGIAATPNGKTLIVLHSTLRLLYTVDPSTGEATAIDLGGVPMTNGDGLLLSGLTLYVVQNRLNQIAVVKLDPTLASGEVVATLTNPNFDVPTSVTRHGQSLYAVNARFATPPTPDTTYTIVRVEER
jgi:sugar lactone lactonase YvrE